MGLRNVLGIFNADAGSERIQPPHVRTTCWCDTDMCSSVQLLGEVHSRNIAVINHFVALDMIWTVGRCDPFMMDHIWQSIKHLDLNAILLRDFVALNDIVVVTNWKDMKASMVIVKHSSIMYFRVLRQSWQLRQYNWSRGEMTNTHIFVVHLTTPSITIIAKREIIEC
jgi:hypothetical protein